VLEGYFIPSVDPALINSALAIGTTAVDVDMSSIFGSASPGVVFMRNRRIAGTNYDMGSRPNGNTQLCYGSGGGIASGAQHGIMPFTSDEFEGTCVTTDAGGIFEVQANKDASITQQLYMWAGEVVHWVPLNTKVWDNVAPTQNIWHDIDTGIGGRGLVFLEVTIKNTGWPNCYLFTRRKGDLRNWAQSSNFSSCGAHVYGYLNDSHMGILAVETDDNGFIQLYPYAQYYQTNYILSLLGYIAGETLPKSGTGLHSHWGSFAATSDLPNVSGSSTQDSAVEVGDRAYVTGTSKSYQCTVATLGSATWTDMEDDPDAIHDDETGEINALSQKLYPTASDLMLIEDVADSNAKKSITCGDLPTGAATDPTAIHDNVAAEISAITQKTTTVLDDLVVIEDSEASNAKKSMKLGSYPRKGSVSNLWFPPSTPHAEDDEFDGSSLDASWYAYNYITAAYESLVTGLDTYDGSYSGDDIRYSLSPASRRSWLLMQGPDQEGLFLGKTITLATNVLVIARLKFNQYYSAMDQNDRTLGLRFRQDSSGEPTGATYINMYLNYSNSSGVVYARYFATDGVTPTDNYSTDVDAQGQALEYVAIHKIGNVYHGWVGTAAGNWIYMGSFTTSTTLGHVGIFTRNDNTSNPGLGVFGVDFIRFYETDNFLF
jgi:hypothetical protein